MYHMDFYRLYGADEVLDLGFDEYFYQSGLTVIEWSVRAISILPEERLSFEIFCDNDVSRTVVIRATSLHKTRILEILEEFETSDRPDPWPGVDI